ncbi:MAG: LacI family transcriptional regulator [Chloroflexi bacterium]|nr:LacI family transcriptional regulator [Chloroflexota bacterium]
MKSVAARAGVSVQTVSAVINNKPGITAKTRQRVMLAVQQLGYRPYSVARSLRTRRTRTIALVVSDIANPSFSTMASAAEDNAHSSGYSVVVYNTHDDITREANYMHTAIERWVDGVLFVSAEDQMTSLHTLRAAGIPSVAIDRIPENYTGASVTLDNVKAGCIAAEHLLSLGHRRIAHISGPLKLRLARERLGGFREAIACQGLDPDMYPPGQGNWECMAGFLAMQQLLAQTPPPTALFAANDRMAIGAMQAAYQAGLRVPQDISIVGLDDIEVAAFQIPPLTTVRQSFAELATRGVQLLLDLLAGKEVSDWEKHVVIEPTLIQRQSTAPPQ